MSDEELGLEDFEALGWVCLLMGEEGGAIVVLLGVATLLELLDSEKRRLRVPPLNMALTSSHACTMACKGYYVKYRDTHKIV